MEGFSRRRCHGKFLPVASASSRPARAAPRLTQQGASAPTRPAWGGSVLMHQSGTEELHMKKATMSMSDGGLEDPRCKAPPWSVL